jgi:hypothetical protein
VQYEKPYVRRHEGVEDSDGKVGLCYRHSLISWFS